MNPDENPGALPPPEARSREPVPPDFSTQKFVAGMLLIAGLAVAGVAVAVAGRGGWDAFRSGANPDLKMLALASGLMLVDIWLGGLRVHHLAHRLVSKLTLGDGLRADLANRCLAGITPWQTGGGAAQIYILARAGLPLSSGVAVGTINFLVSTIVLVLFGFIGLPLVHDKLPGWVQASAQITLWLLVAILIGGVLAIIFSKHKRRTNTHDGRIRRWLQRAFEFTTRSLETSRRLMLVHRSSVIRVFPITVALFLTKLGYTWAVFRAFEPEGFVSEMIGVAVILVLALNFAPTPGGSGVVEGGATAYLAGALPAASAAGIVVYWRLLTAYLPVVIGGLILLAQLRRDSQRVGRSRSSGGGSNAETGSSTGGSGGD
ncbi:MAG: flippase-like domain-containing protein [Gemmatimonadetes bacterium]|nr:flippase-like domain-containing protein [Gemmatimonadota bacterium]